MPGPLAGLQLVTRMAHIDASNAAGWVHLLQGLWACLQRSTCGLLEPRLLLGLVTSKMDTICRTCCPLRELLHALVAIVWQEGLAHLQHGTSLLCFSWLGFFMGH